MQPGLKTTKRRQKFFDTFKGLCLRPVTPEGYFKDAQNTSSDGYPTIMPRRKRGIITECGDVYAMYDHSKVVWLWENVLFYGETQVGELSAGEKMFASLGANIVIYPDKMLFNTDTMTLTSLENEVKCQGVSVFSSNQDASSALSTNYTCLSAPGIGAGFREGDGVSVSGLSGVMPDGDYLIQTVFEDKIVVIQALDAGGVIEGEVSVKRTAPDLDYICALDNRIWGCSSKDHRVCACKLGDPTNWNVFQGISTDAYQAVTPSAGAFTGLTSDLGSVVFFKEEEIIRLFGNKPSNFQLTSYKMPGVEEGSEKSIAYIESALFYKGLSGIYVYDGGIPECISASLGAKKYSSARAGAVNGKYFVSMLDEEAGKESLFVYDTRTGAWHRESAPGIEFFFRRGNEMYFKGNDDKMYTVNGGKIWYDTKKVVSSRLSFTEQSVAWYFETGPMSLCMPGRQYVTNLHVRYSMKADAKFTLEIKFQEEKTYRLVGEYASGTGEGTITLPVPVRRTDSASLRFSGTGECTIIAIGKTFTEGSFY